MIRKAYIKDNFGFLGPYWAFLLLAISMMMVLESGQLIRICSENRKPILDLFFKYGTIAGEHWAYFFFGLVFLFFDKRISLKIGIVGTICLFLSYGLKSFFAHPRPSHQMWSYFQNAFIQVDGVMPHTGFTSFPSGHTLAAFALYATVAFYFKNKGMQALLCIMACTVGLSRIYLGHHFLKDVFLGALIGYFLAWVINSLYVSKANQPVT